jgi:HAD superfamily hydrolase (TIGR01509 family)
VVIKEVIFDFNGVFTVREFLSDSFERDYHVNKMEFMPALKEIMDKVRLPNAPKVFDLWKPYLDKWRIVMTEQEFLDYWFKGEQLVPELVDYAKELKEKGIKIFILSNNFKERTEYYLKKWPELFSLFDGVYFSWKTGFVKSTLEAYKNLLDKNGLVAGECIFFDDSEKNVALAKSLGINAYIYEDFEKTTKIVEQLLG